MTTNQITSLSLLDQLQEPDNNAAWEIFLAIYRPFIRRQLLIAGIAQSDVDDLVQESVAEMLVALPRFHHNGNTGAFRKWLKTIVVRRAYRLLNKYQQLQLAKNEIGLTVEQFDQSFQHRLDREHDEYVVRCLLDLIRPEFTETTWIAFEMQVIDGKRAAEVADCLGSTPNSALICKSRILRRLRNLAKGLVEC